MDLSIFATDKYSRKDFEFLGSLASTPYGHIEKTRNTKDNKEYALKVFEKFHLQDASTYSRTVKEKEILSHFPATPAFHPLICTFSDSENVYFVLEYCPYGNLQHFMQRFSKFPFELARFYAGELVFILQALRQQRIVHGEINPTNLMVTPDFHLHLTNFQHAHDEGRQPGGPPRENSEFDAPEALDGEFTAASDVWAVGCVIYMMLTGKSPFHASATYLANDKIRSGQIEFPGILPPFAVDLIQSMLVPDPAQRLGLASISDLKQHIFFQGLEIDEVYQLPAPDYRHEMSKEDVHKSRVILEGVVKKKAGWIFKRRLLVISEEPKISYYEPTRRELRGEIAISPQLRGEVKNKIDFHIITPKRTYYFKVINDSPEKYVRAVAELVHKVYG
jgi:3-phosphoinositide dependent protein kinase-1